jgi:putative ABC transport system permease protein
VPLWRAFRHGVRALVRRGAADDDLADEVRHYIDEASAAHIARGMSAGEARRAARLEAGSATAVAEQVRVSGWENAVETLAADIRFATRRLRGNPGFTIVAALTLALGIGATTAIFSAIHPILLEPLPYRDAARILVISDVGNAGERADVTFGTYRELASRARTIGALAVMKPWQPAMTGEGEPERFDGQRVSADYFRVLGVSPAIGRAFDASDDRLRGPHVVMLSDGVWRRRFGADPAIIGTQVTLDAATFTVIGVLPPRFENVLSPSADLWAPLQYDPTVPMDGREWGHHLRMIARVRAPFAPSDAARELDAIARQPTAEFPRVRWASLERGLIVSPLRDDIARNVRQTLYAVIGAVALVLLVVCVNVTNLLLARGGQRRAEFAMRAALGAERGRIIRQVLTESVLLAVLGGALGLFVAQAGVRALVALSPPGMPRVHAIGLNGVAFAFALGISAFVGLAVGLVPALQGSRARARDIQASSRRSAGTHQRARGALVVAEVALALVLLVSAGLLLRSLDRLFAIAPGFDPARMVTMQIQISGRRAANDSVARQFLEQALGAVRDVPGVRAAAYTSQLPLSGDADKYGVQFASIPRISSEEDGSAFRYSVSPGYFETMRIPLRRGRVFDARDVAGEAVRPVVISESFARRRFPGQDPIGQRLRFGGPADRPWDEIVGVVGDVKQTSLSAEEANAVYTTTRQWLWVDPAQWLVVRASGDPLALAPAIRRAIWSVDKDQPIVRVATMDKMVATTTAQRRFALIVFEAFALAALALAAIGIYGILSGSVAERMREIGVRAALGASRGEIVALVVRHGMGLTGVGLAIGVLGAAAASRALVALLYSVSPLDPATYIGMVVLLGAVALIATALPAWRAARIDPVITLRSE